MNKNPSIPYDTLVVELGISRRTVSRVFVSLVEKGFILSIFDEYLQKL